MWRFFYAEDRTLKRHISIEVFVVYIDTGSPGLYIPSKSRDLEDENNKILTEWKLFETTVLAFMQTLFTWLFHFKSCLIVRPKYLASSNDSSGWPWMMLLNLIGFLIRVPDRTLDLFGWKAIFYFPSHIAFVKILLLMLCIYSGFHSYILQWSCL